jgi:uncharacterized protein YdeI (YjbR/CyaY-like superfamily)
MDDFCPSNKEEWRKWLEVNHKIKDSIWLVFYKKSSLSPNLSWSESVDEALCFGWIDSTKRSIDSEKYKQYFSKRKKNSTWSKINKDKVDYLTKHGLIKEAGYKCIEVAKKNGSWTMLDEVEALVVPDDLRQALVSRKGSEEYFEGLSKSAKKILLYWIFAAKKTETREKRIAEVAENASKNLKPKQFR